VIANEGNANVLSMLYNLAFEATVVEYDFYPTPN